MLFFDSVTTSLFRLCNSRWFTTTTLTHFLGNSRSNCLACS